MIPDELAAIRARDLDYPGVSDESSYAPYINAIRDWDGSGDPPEGPPDANLWRWYTEAARDRAALLAEVDRLTAQDHRWAATLARGLERDRILAAVEGLDTDGWSVRLGEVIAAIEGETK